MAENNEIRYTSEAMGVLRYLRSEFYMKVSGNAEEITLNDGRTLVTKADILKVLENWLAEFKKE